MELDSNIIKFMKQIYEQGSYSSYIGASSQEYRQIELLIDLGYVYEKAQNYYILTPQGMILLAEYDIAEEPVSILQDFLMNYNGKINWNRLELLDFQRKKKYSDKDMERTLILGEGLRFLRCNFGSNYIPHELEITMLGQQFAKNPENFLTYLHIDDREFKIHFTDNIILDWLKNSSPDSEDFEIEFKINVPQRDELKRVFSGFGSTSSGVIAIGFHDDGRIDGLDKLNEEQNKVFDATTDMKKLDWKKRVVKDDEGKKGLIIMVARGIEPILAGETMFIRDGASFRPAKNKEIIETMKRLQTTQGGHLWLKSLRNYKLKMKG